MKSVLGPAMVISLASCGSHESISQIKTGEAFLAGKSYCHVVNNGSGVFGTPHVKSEACLSFVNDYQVKDSTPELFGSPAKYGMYLLQGRTLVAAFEQTDGSEYKILYSLSVDGKTLTRVGTSEVFTQK